MDGLEEQKEISILKEKKRYLEGKLGEFIKENINGNLDSLITITKEEISFILSEISKLEKSIKEQRRIQEGISDIDTQIARGPFGNLG